MGLKAFVIESGELKLKEMEEPKAKPGEVVVSLKAAGVNRRDLGLIKRYGDNPAALIIGSDGAGTVESVGEDVIDFTTGDAVIINPALRWHTNSEAPPPEFDILGMPDHGTFAEKIAISADQLEKKPRYLSWEEAGSLALPGVTGYRSLFTKGQLKKDDTLFIPGAGSGVATFLIQFAKSVGARVIVTSRSQEKRQHAEKIGADLAIPTDSDWVKELADERIDLVIDSVGGATFNRSLEVLKKGGRIVIFGATTEDNVDFNLRQFFYGQYQLFGSTMGSREELRAMLEHMESNTMRPIIDKAFPMDQAQEAFDHLASGSQFGKVVLSIGQ